MSRTTRYSGALGKSLGGTYKAVKPLSGFQHRLQSHHLHSTHYHYWSITSSLRIIPRGIDDDVETPLYPPQTTKDLETIQQRRDFSRTMTSSIDMKTNKNVIKATFQPQLLEGKGVLDAFDRDAPWARTFHLNERNLIWHDGFKQRLYSKIAAEELSISEQDLEMYLERLAILMPDASDKMRNMNLDTLSHLIESIDALPYKLMMLKRVFPGANASLLAIRTPELVLSDRIHEEDLQAIADELNQMFPRLQVDKLVEENPSMLDILGLKNALKEAKQIMPHLDIQHAMGNDPQLILGFQRGNAMISGGFD